jgi:hypothetical protein
MVGILGVRGVKSILGVEMNGGAIARVVNIGMAIRVVQQYS